MSAANFSICGQFYEAAYELKQVSSRRLVCCLLLFAFISQAQTALIALYPISLENC
jgi:hypothetical protein